MPSTIFFVLQRTAFERPLQLGAFLFVFFLIVFVVFIVLWTFISSIFFLEIIQYVLCALRFFCGF